MPAIRQANGADTGDDALMPGVTEVHLDLSDRGCRNSPGRRLLGDNLNTPVNGGRQLADASPIGWSSVNEQLASTDHTGHRRWYSATPEESSRDVGGHGVDVERVEDAGTRGELFPEIGLGHMA